MSAIDTVKKKAGDAIQNFGNATQEKKDNPPYSPNGSGSGNARAAAGKAATSGADQLVNQRAISGGYAKLYDDLGKDYIKDLGNAGDYNLGVYGADLAQSNWNANADWYRKEQSAQSAMSALNASGGQYGSMQNTLDNVANRMSDNRNLEILNNQMRDRQSALDTYNASMQDAYNNYNANVDNLNNLLTTLKAEYIANMDQIYKSASPSTKPKRSDYDSDSAYNYALDLYNGSQNNPYASGKGINDAAIWKSLGFGASGPALPERKYYNPDQVFANYGRAMESTVLPKTGTDKDFQNHYSSVSQNPNTRY